MIDSHVSVARAVLRGSLLFLIACSLALFFVFAQGCGNGIPHPQNVPLAQACTSAGDCGDVFCALPGSGECLSDGTCEYRLDSANTSCQCVENAARPCNISGQVGIQTCARIGVSTQWGTCNPLVVCTAGQTECVGSNQTHTCNATGQWEAPVACAPGEVCTGNACTNASCPEYFADADGDGQGDRNGSAVRSCTGVPAGRVANNFDCCDSDAEAKTGQTAWFSRARNGCGGFDFDCSGSDEPRYGPYIYLPGAGCSVARKDGWTGTPPTCGNNGPRMEYQCAGGSSASACCHMPTTRTEECR